jgi:hypothetical protein
MQPPTSDMRFKGSWKAHVISGAHQCKTPTRMRDRSFINHKLGIITSLSLWRMNRMIFSLSLTLPPRKTYRISSVSPSICREFIFRVLILLELWKRHFRWTSSSILNMVQLAYNFHVVCCGEWEEEISTIWHVNINWDRLDSGLASILLTSNASWNANPHIWL